VINEKLLSDIRDYCKINNLEVDSFINKLLRDAFMIEKYGNKPKVLNVDLGITKEKSIQNKFVEPVKTKEVGDIGKINRNENKEIDIYGE